MTTSRIALLRGVNVGGKNKLPMKDLADMFREAGCTDVATYIQSGNVVFRARATLARELPACIVAAIAVRHGIQTVIVMRTAAEWAEMVANNPFATPSADPKALAVAFLADTPSAARIAALDPRRSPPDEFAVRGADVYLRLRNGFARTKLTNAWFDSKLATTSTARNWRTVLELFEMARG